MSYEELIKKLDEVKGKLDDVEKIALRLPLGDKEAVKLRTLDQLPDHLRKTMKVLYNELDEVGTAGMVANETGRARAVESNYLNQLVMTGHLTYKGSKPKIFQIAEKYSTKYM